MLPFLPSIVDKFFLNNGILFYLSLEFKDFFDDKKGSIAVLYTLVKYKNP